MRQLKNNFLALNNRFIVNRTPQHRQIIGLQKASSIGILCYIQQEKDYDELAALVKTLKGEGKKVNVLTYSAQTLGGPNSLKYPSFTDQSVSLTGQIKDTDVEQFTASVFDLLYCISQEPLAVLDTVLLRSKALCRAGKHFANKEYLFEIMVNPLQPTQLIDQLLHYTRLINNP